MHTIEPYFLWRTLYDSAKDKQSLFYNRQYSELYFTNKVYDHLIHPQWDFFGSETLFVKVLFADYDERYAIIEMIGEWNDCIYNDIMTFKRDFIDLLIDEGINQFILIGENVLNFHASDDSYYEEWFEDLEDGWVALINFHEHVLLEMKRQNLHFYLNFGGELNDVNWRNMKPTDLHHWLDEYLLKKYLP